MIFELEDTTKAAPLLDGWKKTMKIGIICADDEEVEPILKEMEITGTTEKAMLKIHEGTLWGIDTVALFCGACRSNAALATQLVIDLYDVDRIINVGAGGGMDPVVRILDTVIAEECIYCDIQERVLTGYHPWMGSDWFKSDPELLLAARKAAQKISSKYKIHFGKIATSEKFIIDEGRKEIMEKFSPLSVDMETAAIAHVCYVNKVPFLAIRTITDTEEYSGDDNYNGNLEEATYIGRDITKALFEELR